VLDRADALPDVQTAALRGAFGLSAERVEDRFPGLRRRARAADRGGRRAAAAVRSSTDAHWLDGASAEALVFVARRLQADPIAVLIGAREGDARQFDAHGLPELRLRRPERGRRRRADRRRAAGRPCARTLVGATGGNPLALLELPGRLSDDERSGRAPLRSTCRSTSASSAPSWSASSRSATTRGACSCWRRPTTAATSGPAAGVRAARLRPRRPSTSPSAPGPADRQGTPAALPPSARALGGVPRRGLRRAPAAHEALAAVLDDDADVDRRAWHRAAAATAPDDEAAEALAAPPTIRAARGGHSGRRPRRWSAPPSSTPIPSAGAAAPRRRPSVGARRPRRPRRRAARSRRARAARPDGARTAARVRGMARWPSGARGRLRVLADARADRCCRPTAPPGSRC
jgi:hypothetical protein